MLVIQHTGVIWTQPIVSPLTHNHSLLFFS